MNVPAFPSPDPEAISGGVGIHEHPCPASCRFDQLERSSPSPRSQSSFLDATPQAENLHRKQAHLARQRAGTIATRPFDWQELLKAYGQQDAFSGSC